MVNPGDNHLVMRRFALERDHDVTGQSGTGTVAEGVQFTDGRVVMRWYAVPGITPTTVLHDSVDNVVSLHGHGGHTRVVWLDPMPGSRLVQQVST